MFDWDSLRYFNAFVREGSLAAAARSLDVEHATVARRISALERIPRPQTDSSADAEKRGASTCIHPVASKNNGASIRVKY